MRFPWIWSLTLVAAGSMADACDKWFERSGIKKGTSDCLSRCVVLDVGMGNFSCPTACPALCKAGTGEDFLFQVSDLYPRLTLAERALVAKRPKEMLRAYRLSWDAERLCASRFKVSATNDESDACRHIVWAILLDREFGRQEASEILKAHETEPEQPKDEMEMDVANNRIGFVVSSELGPQANEIEIMQKVDRTFSKKQPVVLKPRSNSVRSIP